MNIKLQQLYTTITNYFKIAQIKKVFTNIVSKVPVMKN